LQLDLPTQLSVMSENRVQVFCRRNDGWKWNSVWCHVI